MKRTFVVGSLSLLGLSAVAMLGVGCGSPTEMLNTNTAGLDYPAGPYGYAAGSTIEDLQLVGQHDDNGNGIVTDDAVRTIRLSDYYKRKDIKVLVVLVAAEWCNPCRIEQPEIIKLYSDYKTGNSGVEFVEAIIQDSKGAPADIATVDRWGNTKWGGAKIAFDLVADPTVALGPYYNIAAFPMQMVIRTKDMNIRWQNNGVDSQGVKDNIDAVLAGM